MHSNQFTAVDFLADETFLNYVNKTVDKDVIFWQNYIKNNPDKVDEINIAKQMLKNLSANKKSVNAELSNFKEQFYKRQLETEDNHYDLPVQATKTNFLKYAFLVAMFIVIATVAFFKFNLMENLFTKDAEVSSVYKTNVGQRKKVILQDGTSILLNADSKIALRTGFNKETRELDLTGEAYFEVAHNPKVPFIVHTNKMNVKVLGTVFNVKAYPSEKSTVATLISGKIEASFNNQKDKNLILKPNDKVTVLHQPVLQNANKVEELQSDKIVLGHSTINVNQAISETFWVKNGFEINNETFEELQEKLEREYDVKLIFKDEASKKMKFTATLKDEPISEILRAMQTVNYFKYTMKDNTIEISK